MFRARGFALARSNAPNSTNSINLYALRRARAFATDAAASSSNKLSSNPTVKERLKHLFKTYGWYTLGVYLAASAVDFGFTFAAINFLGADKVSHAAKVTKDYISGFFGRSKTVEDGTEKVKDHAEDASVASPGREGLYATAVLAYTIHKTLLLPFRVGVTAAVTPKFVKFLQARGWAGAKGARQAGREMRAKAADLKEKAREKVQRKLGDD